MADERQDTPAGKVPLREPSRRERTRAATVEEIKQTARALMREHGTTDFRFSDIARIMGMTAPALYRYFADRDELLTALIVDAYDDLSAAVAARREQASPGDIGAHFLEVCRAYREWAGEDPERFALIFGLPVPGYSAPEEGPTTEAAMRAMTQLKSLFFEALERGILGAAALPAAPSSVREFCVAEHQAGDPAVDRRLLPAETFQAMLLCWSTLHGFVSLEAHGHLAWMPDDVRESIFVAGVRAAATTAGLPDPDESAATLS